MVDAERFNCEFKGGDCEHLKMFFSNLKILELTLSSDKICKKEFQALLYKLFYKKKGGYKKEKELHKKFADDCIKNEWFRPSDKLLSYIEQIKGEKE